MAKSTIFASLVFLFCTGTAFSQEKLHITFKDGKELSFDTNSIQKMEFRSTQPATQPAAQSAAGCWAGHYSGVDTGGYPMDIHLTEIDGKVEGGYKYYHKAEQKDVSAVLTDVTIQGNVLRGRWKQIKGIIFDGGFEWKWLPNGKCQSFEGMFDGTKYWPRMNKR